MKFRSYFSEGIVLARRNFSDADRILTLYTKHFGKVSVLAKGVKKIKSRKRGHIEIFSYIKFQATSSKSLGIVTEVEVIDSFNKIRGDLRKVTVAYFFCEVIAKVTVDEEKSERLFDLLLENLNLLKHAKALKPLRFNFIKDVLTAVGFWPAGKKMPNPDYILEDVLERTVSSARVGKKILS